MQIEKLGKNGLHLTNVFSPEEFSVFLHMFENFKVAYSDKDRDGYIREIMEIHKEDPIFKLIETKFSTLISEFNKEICWIEAWRDYPGYTNMLHFDDPLVQNIVVIYFDTFDDANNTMGTEYIDDGEILSVPCQKNTAFLLLGSSNLEHGMVGAVPRGVVRHTIYFNFK